MNLSDIYKTEGFAGLKRLAEMTGADPQYLRQCATGWRNKRPSPELADQLTLADPRLDFRSLLLPTDGDNSVDGEPSTGEREAA
jgi:hypothetical protein